MKHIKLFEKYKKFKYNKADYVKVLPMMGPRVDMENRERMVYQIYGRRKKAQGWIDDANVYWLKQVYEPYEEINSFHEFHEEALRDLTEEEKYELELNLTTKKYNL